MNNTRASVEQKREATLGDQVELDNEKETVSFWNRKINIKKTNESDAERVKAAKRIK